MWREQQTQAALQYAERHLNLSQRWQIARARAARILARDFDPSQPRDEHGRWTDGGGDGGGGDKREHPGAGYSKDSYVKDGVIHTTSVEDAARALGENRKVELDQPRKLSILIQQLGAVTQRMIEQGEKAPTFDLCRVTLRGTSLFCVESHGIPRVQMPQLDQQQTAEFQKYLTAKGYKIETGEQYAAYLRATQNELNGAKVAKIAEELRNEPNHWQGNRRVIVSKDDYILDGHHNWGAKIGLDAADNILGNESKINIARVDISITKLLEEAELFTGGKGKVGVEQRRARPAVPGKTNQRRWQKNMRALQGRSAKANADAAAARIKWDESEHPREPAGSSEGGQFTSAGGGGDGGEAAAAAEPAKLDPTVTNVGGDAWNQAVALRLERDYQAAKPKLDALANESPGKTSTVAKPDESDVEEIEEEEEPPFVPDEWDQLTSADQDSAKEQYVSNNTQMYLDSEIENWSSEYAPDDAKTQVAEDFNAGQNTEWAVEALDQIRADREESGEPPIPYTNEQLLEAINIDYENQGGSWPKKDPEFSFEFPPDPSQMTLPGVEPPTIDPSESAKLTKDMREDIEEGLLGAFNEEADDVVDKLEPPEYLKDSAVEYAEESWEQMEDDEKFEWVKGNTNIIEDESTPGSSGSKPETAFQTVDKLPDQFDPLQKGTESASDYRRTQAVARYLSIARTREVLEERKLPAPDDDALASVDKRLWSSWKSSSTSIEGMLLQVATSDELGGRLNKVTATTINRDEMIEYANRKYANIGGYDGVKAYLRAKWETTQYLLDRAGIKELNLYRGIRLDNQTYEKVVELLMLLIKAHESKRKIEGHMHLPDVHIARNGAASTSVDANVANGWGADGSRVVLRIQVPRTAALSVPAYGINMHSEREVVIAGTAWKGWDVWSGIAPDFDKVPVKQAA